ncbi:cytochrome c oxidase assembly protein [Halopseudomonas salegens]|uniref:Cytochrome c oxidase assembly protein CtaG n=1 Tax=Halopseudomonas salegens TaxID=1434072 RepID=A0A1H2HZ08_9GAMM|nr:cytochrome c oxidase assembly protein [Halopseudomonas salegens]SDU37122.1 cytochrome c oxidase assembly protein subunit 11 [Halopseudomonas salegens]
MTEAMSTKRLVTWLFVLVVGMFGFGFALVPIYDVICDAFGINGKTNSSAYAGGDEVVDETRDIRIQFISSNAEGMVWRFGPETSELVLHPGEPQVVNFTAHNPTSKPMVAQAIPSVAPSTAAAYLHKTECFCFEQQVLQPGETVEMPVRFIIDPGLPREVRRMTLAYTLFDVTERMSDLIEVAALQTN